MIPVIFNPYADASSQPEEALEHAVRGAQAEHEAPFLHGVGELTAGAVVNGGKFHKHYPFTEPEVTPDT